MRVILKGLFIGFLGYLFMLMAYDPYLVPVIFGLLVAAIYFTAIKLRAINEDYAARVKNGIKWMKISILLGILPWVIIFFFYFITRMGALSSDFFGDWCWYDVEAFLDKYPFIGGPLAYLIYVMDKLFPGSNLNMFVSISLWLLVPLIIGYFIYKTRRNYNETFSKEVEK